MPLNTAAAFDTRRAAPYAPGRRGAWLGALREVELGFYTGGSGAVPASLAPMRSSSAAGEIGLTR